MAMGAAQWVLVAILAGGVGLLGFGAVALAQLVRLRRRTDAAGDTLHPGVLAIEGRASATEPGETVRSPITGGAALLYEYAVQLRAGSAQTPDWRTVTAGQNGVSFRLETGDGAVLVDPRGASLELPIVDEVEFEADPAAIGPKNPSIDALAVDAEAGTVVVGDVPLTNGERYRILERRIEPGDSLPVAGVATTPDGGTPASTDGAGASRNPDDDPRLAFRRTRGTLRRTFGVPFVIGDADGGARTRLRNRAIVGALFGLPLVMLAGVYLVAA